MWRSDSGSKCQVSGAKWVVFLVVIAVAMEYGFWTWDTPERAEQIALGLEGRPFVYRALIPFLARILIWVGLPAEVALQGLVVLSAIGLVFALKYLMDVTSGS